VDKGVMEGNGSRGIMVVVEDFQGRYYYFIITPIRLPSKFQLFDEPTITPFTPSYARNGCGTQNARAGTTRHTRSYGRTAPSP
jgi:hypothetical protein